MKHIIITIALTLAFLISETQISLAQNTIKREGTTFIQEKAQKTPAQNQETGFTYKDSKGQEYPIYISKTGSCYIIKVSQKTGEPYRKYLGEEISSQICKELGINYQPKSKN